MSDRKLFVSVLIFVTIFLQFCLFVVVPNGNCEYENSSYWGEPDITAADNGYFIWATDNGDGWRLIFESDGTKHTINATVNVTGEFHTNNPLNLSANDSLEIGANDKIIFFNATVTDSGKGFKFYFTGEEVTFDLKIDGIYDKNQVFLGMDRENPTDLPFTLNINHRYYISRILGNEQQDAPNMTLPQPLVVKVRDESMNPVKDIEISFSVEPPDGAVNTGNLNTPVATDENGNASTEFTFGDKAGLYIVTAKLESVANSDNVVFRLTAIQETPENLIILSGNNQHWGVNSTFPKPLVFRITGEFDNPLRHIKTVAEMEESHGGYLSTEKVGSFDDKKDRVVIYTDSNGIGSFNFTAGDFEGEYQIMVYPDMAPEITNSFHEYAGPDMDGDGEPDANDPDLDGDGWDNAEDAFPHNPHEWQDFDGDGQGDNTDPDDDNDGYNDTLEEASGSDPRDHGSQPLDVDHDGIPDTVDIDDDNDGLTDEREENFYHSDPEKHSFFQGDPTVFHVNTNPQKPTSITTIDLVVHMASRNQDDGSGLEIILYYKTLTSDYIAVKMEQIPLQANQLEENGMEPEAIPEMYGQGYTEDYSVIAYHTIYAAELEQFSTGEEITYYLEITLPDEKETRHPYQGEETFKIEPGIEVVNEPTDETYFAFLFAIIGGLIASKRMKNRLTKVSYTDIQWWDAVNKKAFVKIVKIFRDVSEVKEVLKRNTGRMIRFLYFTGVAGLLMLAFELLYDPRVISSYSLGLMGFFLIFTVASPVIYVYFSRWKYKNPTVGKLRILFFILFPILIISQIGQNNYELGYLLVFLFLYSIPMLLYGNLMGSNWNFLIFNSWKEFRTGFDHLTNKKSGIAKRIFAIFFFLAIFSMPFLAVNSLAAITNGTYEEGGFLGQVSTHYIENLGYEYYAQIFARFVAVFIILNVLLLGVAMVFRVIQLQFYASQKFSSRIGFGFKFHFKLKESREEQRTLIGFAFFVFFGYAVLLLLLAIYSQIAFMLPSVPYLSESILKDLLFYQTAFANGIFVFFWFVSLPRLGKMFKLKRHEDGFVIPR